MCEQREIVTPPTQVEQELRKALRSACAKLFLVEEFTDTYLEGDQALKLNQILYLDEPEKYKDVDEVRDEED